MPTRMELRAAQMMYDECEFDDEPKKPKDSKFPLAALSQTKDLRTKPKRKPMEEFRARIMGQGSAEPVTRDFRGTL